MKLNEELVAIHAHVCGDGNMYIKKENRSPSSIRTSRSIKPFNRFIIEYTNTCPELLDRMTIYIKKLFPQTYVLRSNNKFRIQARNKILFDILKNLGYDKDDWIIPQEIVHSSEFRRIWLRAFFDDEGTVREASVLCYNTNKKAMLMIREMLELEGFKTSFYSSAPKQEKYKTLYIIRVAASSYLLFQKIGFNHTKKRIKYMNSCKKRINKLGLNAPAEIRISECPIPLAFLG